MARLVSSGVESQKVRASKIEGPPRIVVGALQRDGSILCLLLISFPRFVPLKMA